MFAVQAEGRSLTTIEGMAKDGVLHPLQQSLLGRARAPVRLLHARLHHAAAYLLDQNPNPRRMRSGGPGGQPLPLQRAT